MKIRFQADNDLDEDILRAAKRLQPGMDAHPSLPSPSFLKLSHHVKV